MMLVVSGYANKQNNGNFLVTDATGRIRHRRLHHPA